jgi:tetratricopeptide (TPR) repeat protein
MAGYFVDRRLADEFGDEALALFEQSLGLGLWQRLRPVLGSRLAFFVGFGSAAVRFLLVPALGGIAGLRKTISDFIACVTTLTGAAAAILDPARARSIARRLEPFTALGSGHAATLAYRFVTLLSILPEERVMEVIAGFRELVARLEDPRPIPDLPPPLRRALYGGALYALGSMEIFREGPGALECAEKLEQSGLKIDEMVANQLRTLHHALRGEAQLADHYRSRVEANAILGGNGWQVEVWVPTSTLLIYILTQDVIGVKRSSEQIDRLSQEIPSLRRKALEARGEYHHLKGEHELGFKFLQVFSPSIPPHSFLGWSNAAASHVRALNRLGRHAEAKALIEPIIAGLSEDDRSVFAFNGNLFRELAHAHAGLGDHAAATALIDELLQRHAPSQNPLLLGNLHATAVAIAAGAGETARALEHLAHMDKWFRPTGNPSLIGQCERLLRQLDRVGDDHGARPDIAAHESASEEGTRSVRSLLSQCLDGDQRAELSRRLLLTHMRAQSGYLFAYDEQGLRLIAPQHGQEPPNELVLRIVANIASDAEAEAATVITRAPGSSSMPPPMPNADIEQAYRVFLLSVPSRGCMQTVGAIAVAVDAHPLQAPDQAFLQNVAYSLFESGAASATETKQS